MKNVLKMVAAYMDFVWYKLTPNKKVVLANQEAIQKMEELEQDFQKTQLSSIESSLRELVEIEKLNQELLVHLCTTNEELLNTFSQGELTLIGGEEEDDEELINSHWDQKKTSGLN